MARWSAKFFGISAWAVVVVVSSTVAMSATASGCGASYQAVYEGEVRFEHCYRLDRESNMPLMHRRECWREWIEFYTYGQTRDRIEFAERRLRELSDQLQNPGASSSSDAGLSQPPAVIAPAPTSPFVAPPAIHPQEHHDAGPAASVSTAKPVASDDSPEIDPANTPPGQLCMISCGKAWHKCVNACPTDKTKTCRTTCDIRFRGCIPRCL